MKNEIQMCIAIRDVFRLQPALKTMSNGDYLWIAI